MGTVYSITNTKNSKKYIGSTVDYEERVKSHLRGLRGGYHDNRKLQKDFNIYGEESFKFEILHEIKDDIDRERFKLEEQAVKFYESYETGYNLSYDGRGNYVVTEETREKFRDNAKGDRNPFYGKTHSIEVKNKLSEYASKRVGDKNPFYNRTHSEVTKDKIREAIRCKYDNGWEHPMKGVPKTDIQKRNNMLGQPRRKEVIAEGCEYPSISACATELGISRATVRNRINSDKFPDYHFINDR